MGNRLRLPRYRYRYVLVILSLIIYYFSNHPKEALQKPLLPSRMEQKCSVQFFLTTPGGAVFFTNTIVKYYYDHIHNLVVLWKSCSMAN